MSAAVRHPARFSPSILDVIAECIPEGARVLDPFAGTGRIHELPFDSVGVEIEPEWAALHPRTIVGNALRLPFKAETFDVIATSPCYGNRFADHHQARDDSIRHSYTHDLGRTLHPDNAGQLHWGDAYRRFHERAWAEARRVLRPGGLLVLNVSDHIRRGAVVPVVGWHTGGLKRLGFRLLEDRRVLTPRLRYGVNGAARVDCEHVLVLVFERGESR